MKSVSYKEFRKFLNSDVDESIYFGCSKDNLITLKEYLECLKIRFDRCESNIASSMLFNLVK